MDFYWNVKWELGFVHYAIFHVFFILRVLDTFFYTLRNFHINKLKSLQSKILRTIVNAPWYFRNEDVRKDLNIPTVKEEISGYAEKYKEKTATH